MERKICIILTFIFLFVGCASTQSQSRFTENAFVSDNPKLKVQILKNVSKQVEDSKQGSGYKTYYHYFNTGSGEVVGITIWRFRYTSSAEWRSSDEELLRSIGCVPLGPITINNKTWAKFVDFTQENNMGFGYFKRMGNNLVAVYYYFNNEKYKDEIESFKNTRVLTERHKQLINKAFDHIEKLFVIG
jgi:hypothetical protein